LSHQPPHEYFSPVATGLDLDRIATGSTSRDKASQAVVWKTSVAVENMLSVHNYIHDIVSKGLLMMSASCCFAFLCQHNIMCSSGQTVFVVNCNVNQVLPRLCVISFQRGTVLSHLVLSFQDQFSFLLNFDLILREKNLRSQFHLQFSAWQEVNITKCISANSCCR